MKYFKNTLWLFAEKILRLVMGLFVGIWAARYLGPEQFGLLSYAQSFVGLFSTIAALGLNNIVVRELLKDENRRYEIIGTAFWLSVMGAFLVLGVLAAAVNFTSNDTYTNLLVFIIASASVFQAFNVVDMYFQSKVLSKYVAYANMFSLFISSIVKIALIMNNATLLAFAWVVLFDSIVLALGFIYFYMTHNSEFTLKKYKFDKDTAIYLLKDSWPLVFSSLAVAFYMKIDQVMIKEMMDKNSVGYYSAAVKISEIWLFLTAMMTRSLYPSIINAKKISSELYYSRLQKMYQFLVLTALSISLIVSLFSHEIVYYSFGEAYMDSVSILTIYVWSNIFVFLNNASWNWYIAENLQHIAAVRIFLGAVVNVLLNIVLIEKYGLVGAAYATLISYSIASYFGNLLSRKTWINFNMQTKAIINVFNFPSYYK